MKKFIITTIVAGSFFMGAAFCLIFGRYRIGKLHMYIDPQGNGMIFLKDGHIAGLTTNNENSFDMLFQDSGFCFYFFHSTPDLSFQSVDFNGDGIPEKILIENGDKDEVEKLVRSITIECCSP